MLVLERRVVSEGIGVFHSHESIKEFRAWIIVPLSETHTSALKSDNWSIESSFCGPWLSTILSMVSYWLQLRSEGSARIGGDKQMAGAFVMHITLLQFDKVD